MEINVPVKNNANRPLNEPQRAPDPHYGELVDLKSKNFHITMSSTCPPIADLNELTCMQMRYTRPLKL